MGNYFGTDGVRGIANQKLTPELALKIGKAGAYILSQNVPSKTIILGKDTRLSGDMLEGALIAGICSVGVNVIKVGVLPTPAIAYLTKHLDSIGGIVISASHNPMQDNGIKFFGSNGYKLPDQTEAKIEELMENIDSINLPVGKEIGKVLPEIKACELYSEFLQGVLKKDFLETNFKGLKVVLDCANGSAFDIAPKIIASLGAEVISFHQEPNGENINDNCGSTHPENLMEKVVSCKADLGLAFDGDADRLLAIDELGNLVDGDQIMVICAKDKQKKGTLSSNAVVVTVMSNLGLHLSLKESGIKIYQTKVGDRYVLEECLKIGANFGGEQSGHILFLEHNTTGDGLLTALELLAVIKESNQKLSILASQMERLPQILKNVPVMDKNLVMQSQELKKAIIEQEKLLNGQGRILVRPSGTEELVRIMAEGRNLDQLNQIISSLVKIVEKIN